MNNEELDKLLKSAPVPEASPEFREDLARRVTITVRQQKPHRKSADIGPRGFAFRNWALGGGAAVAIILTAVLAGANRSESRSVAAIARAEKYFREIESLFPHQVRSVVLGTDGPQMVLAEAGDVPDSPPVYLKICGPRGCQEIVTFSGQQVQVNGEMCDVLLDSAGGVLLVGQDLVWSSSNSAKSVRNYRIQAQALGTTS